MIYIKEKLIRYIFISYFQRGRPNGYGKMYYKNGSVFIGQFFNGIADGLGHYVKNDGSFYRGYLKNNMANDENGYYLSKSP